MFTRGYATSPCTQLVYSLGFAVRPIRPYGRVENKREGILTSMPRHCSPITHKNELLIYFKQSKIIQQFFQC